MRSKHYKYSTSSPDSSKYDVKKFMHCTYRAVSRKSVTASAAYRQTITRTSS